MPLRFAIKIYFTNGEVKLYYLPIVRHFENVSELVFCSNSYVFTDKIFSSGRLTESRKLPDAIPKEWLYNGQGVEYINGYSISVEKLYHDSQPFSK